jgi:hypothetical protein
MRFRAVEANHDLLAIRPEMARTAELRLGNADIESYFDTAPPDTVERVETVGKDRELRSPRSYRLPDGRFAKISISGVFRRSQQRCAAPRNADS